MGAQGDRHARTRGGKKCESRDIKREEQRRCEKLKMGGDGNGVKRDGTV